MEEYFYSKYHAPQVPWISRPGSFWYRYCLSRSESREKGCSIKEFLTETPILSISLDAQNVFDTTGKKICADLVVGIEENIGCALFPDLAAVLLPSDVGWHYSDLKPKQILDSLVEELRNNGMYSSQRRLSRNMLFVSLENPCGSTSVQGY
jgi:hypothetical protein